MKKVIYLFLAFCISANTYVSAQKGAHEFSVNYGAISDNTMVDLLTKVLSSTLSAGYYNPDKIKYVGDFGLTYRYGVSDRFSVGASAMYGQSNYNALENNVLMGKGTTTYTTVAAEAKFDYFRNDLISLYGFLGAGATFWNYGFKAEAGKTEPETIKPATLFNAQFTPIGISVGKQIGGFAEVGFGYKGLATIGLYVRL